MRWCWIKEIERSVGSTGGAWVLRPWVGTESGSPGWRSVSHTWPPLVSQLCSPPSPASSRVTPWLLEYWKLPEHMTLFQASVISPTSSLECPLFPATLSSHVGPAFVWIGEPSVSRSRMNWLPPRSVAWVWSKIFLFVLPKVWEA